MTQAPLSPPIGSCPLHSKSSPGQEPGFLFEAITIAPDNIPVREIAPINDNSPDKLIAIHPPTEPLIPDKANPPPIVHVDVSNTAINGAKKYPIIPPIVPPNNIPKI